MQNPNQLSLVDLVEWYTAMLRVAQSLNGNINIKLGGILEQGKFHADKLLSNPEELKQEIDQYLQKNRPFEWNRGRKSNKANDEKDWEQHDNLTLFALLLGSKSLLKEWGVDYPLGTSGPGLADPSETYIKSLEEVKEGCEVEAQKEYYEYLIAELRRHPRMQN